MADVTNEVEIGGCVVVDEMRSTAGGETRRARRLVYECDLYLGTLPGGYSDAEVLAWIEGRNVGVKEGEDLGRLRLAADLRGLLGAEARA